MVYDHTRIGAVPYVIVEWLVLVLVAVYGLLHQVREAVLVSELAHGKFVHALQHLLVRLQEGVDLELPVAVAVDNESRDLLDFFSEGPVEHLLVHAGNAVAAMADLHHCCALSPMSAVRTLISEPTHGSSRWKSAHRSERGWRKKHWPQDKTQHTLGPFTCQWY